MEEEVREITPSLHQVASALPVRDTDGTYLDHAWREVRRYAATSEDGHESVISVSRMPAMFWRVQCPDLGIDLATGSSMHDMAESMAQAIASGMLGQGES